MSKDQQTRGAMCIADDCRLVIALEIDPAHIQLRIQTGASALSEAIMQPGPDGLRKKGYAIDYKAFNKGLAAEKPEIHRQNSVSSICLASNIDQRRST